MIGDPTDRDALRPITFIETALTGVALASIPANQIPDGVLMLGIVHYVGGPFRFRVDGPAPTATSGWPAQGGDVQYLAHREVFGFQATLEQGATSGTVRIGLYVRDR